MRRAHIAFISLLLVGAGCIGEIGGGTDRPPEIDDEAVTVRAPLRRLTRFEYNNTVFDLFGDATAPANALPSDEIGNGFGNDADSLSASALLVEQYGDVAEQVAESATTPISQLSRYADCVTAPTSEADCARDVISGLLPAAFRRPVDAEEIDGLMALYTELSTDHDFASSVAGVIEAILQSPEFLYRPELGVSVDGRRQLTGAEMASRLSYFLWSTMPDETLRDAAAAGELATADGVRDHATRMLDDPRAKPMIRFFFDNMLPIGALPNAERSEETYPTFTSEIGGLMHEETQRFLEYVIFEGEGDWPTALTAPYSFMNETLASYYGVAGVSGDAFVKVDLDGQRRGLLTLGGFLTGTTHSNTTSPVKRGGFLAKEVLCLEIPFPTGELAEQVTPPDPYGGATARERYSQHSEDPVCATCHQQMDPMGLALENFDAVGLWRDTENDVTIDPSGSVPNVEGEVGGPVELVEAIAATEAAQACFAHHWMNFAYGRSVDDEDETTVAAVDEFFAADYNIKALIVALTQTPSFLALPAEPE